MLNDQAFKSLFRNEEARKWELEDMKEAGFQEGLGQGIEQNKIETAKTMFQKNLDIAIISECIGLSLQQIMEL